MPANFAEFPRGDGVRGVVPTEEGVDAVCRVDTRTLKADQG